MNRYRLSTEAQNDLDEIANYIESRSNLDRAVKVVSEIREECRKLGEWPGMGHFRGEIRDKRIKFWSIYSYLIAYRWKSRPVEIIAVVHGERDLAAFFNERKQ